MTCMPKHLAWFLLHVRVQENDPSPPPSWFSPSRPCIERPRFVCVGLRRNCGRCSAGWFAMSAIAAYAVLGLSPIQKTCIILACAVGSWLVAIVVGMQAAQIAVGVLSVLLW